MIGIRSKAMNFFTIFKRLNALEEEVEALRCEKSTLYRLIDLEGEVQTLKYKKCTLDHLINEKIRAIDVLENKNTDGFSAWIDNRFEGALGVLTDIALNRNKKK
jgi:hypothetical protein